MSMPDVELARWRDLWTADDTSLVSARRIAARGRARMTRRLVLETVLGLVWVGVAVAIAMARPQPSVLVLAGGIILLVIAAWTFSIWNHAGAWRPLGESVRDYLEIAIERRRRDLRAVRVAFWASLVEIALLVAWIAWTDQTGLVPAPMGGHRAWLVVPAAVPIAVWLWLFVWRRRALAELRTLRDALQNLDV